MQSFFKIIKISDLNHDDSFFDSLKKDYGKNAFSEWLAKKADVGQYAYVLENEGKILAFLYLKTEQNEKLEMKEKKFIFTKAVKIGTLKIDDLISKQRFGEGALGIALMQWKRSDARYIYITLYPKQEKLLGILEKFGFMQLGVKNNGELVVYKDKERINHSDVYSSYPYSFDIEKKFSANILPIKDEYHDKLFPLSDFKGRPIPQELPDAANGITKTYICNPSGETKYREGNPIFIYRKSSIRPAKFHSGITSEGVISKIVWIKKKWQYLLSFDEYLNIIKNKSIFNEQELKTLYYRSIKNILLIEIIYTDFYGTGNVIIYDWLNQNGLMGNTHPFEIEYTKDQYISIKEWKNV